jgi:hypothetical protein
MKVVEGAADNGATAKETVKESGRGGVKRKETGEGYGQRAMRTAVPSHTL